MGIVELITAIGDDGVKLQNLDHCASDLIYSAKKGTKITFGTEEPVNLKGTVKLGLVLWLDREQVAAIMAKANTVAAAAGTAEPVVGKESSAQERQEQRSEPSPHPKTTTTSHDHTKGGA